MNIKNVKKRESLSFEEFLKVSANPFDKKNLSKEKRDGLNTIKREQAYDFVGYADAVFGHQSKIDYPSIFDPHQQNTADVGITENKNNKNNMKNNTLNELEAAKRRVLSFDQFVETYHLEPSIEKEVTEEPETEPVEPETEPVEPETEPVEPETEEGEEEDEEEGEEEIEMEIEDEEEGKEEE